MIAHVEVSRGPRRWSRWWVATYDELDAQHCVRVRYDSLGEREIEVYT